MGRGPSILRFDAFSKTVDDARIKTTSGGILTLVCILTTLLLLVNEYADYSRVVTRPELVVDRDRNKKLEINLDISFQNMPCDLLTLDIMDQSGDMQLDLLSSGFSKIRLDRQGNEIGQEDMRVNQEFALTSSDPSYCGSCYGAADQSRNDELPQDQKVCCNSCESVKQASMNFNEKHVHDLSLYDKHSSKFNFDHTINHFSFGLDDHSVADYRTTHPLDATAHRDGQKYHVYSYFLKVVNTRYEFLDGRKVETNQFSATQHDRPFRGGRDADHPNTIHAQGGLPGVFFHFEISPLKIINREQYNKTWSAFALGACAAISGVLTVFTLLDRTIWAANRLLKDKKDT
ncbi:hypothetical protein KL930_000791 [Ogataea haglerorum]|uniref:Endoplasmic reticulum-Golgi intermediate compartment protein n=1 Tax=Ogataea haglerorum TaxID=1937702 RepID=A0AAN6D9S7_9ASCO|nr:uncharacterized protein KL911_003474 [Ogataea haglerorum]KAG7700104.1 hypothetical protein KL915_000793 [Ogataea haglerorum]KAG7712346.1 hypothetical protein KL950_000217 [Ogataea haglerorum]KAG7722398.1 hypothetical protein KL913_000218 [Ogataea haglerorum]KAG7723498.1 hypothetical protein KL949_000548 [Ogataea haglerorum]KAG7730752.1 hypothetical protein KL933_000547 [Ogataea haglerorum]